jgi:hypothetical protein
MNKFKSGDYIVTKDGFRGYVVTKESYCENAYTIRLASGYAIYSGNDLEIDLLMYKEMVEVCDISK